MSFRNKVFVLVCVGLSFCCLLFLGIYSGMMSRKIAALYANKDDMTEIELPDPSFDVTDEEATRELLDKVSGIGTEVAQMQNHFRESYRTLGQYPEDKEKRTPVINKMVEDRKTLAGYFDEEFASEWMLLDPQDDFTWTFHPIYSYGGEKIPVMWTLSGTKNDRADSYAVVSGYYSIQKERFISMHSWLTSEGVGAMPKDADWEEEFLNSLKEFSDLQKGDPSDEASRKRMQEYWNRLQQADDAADADGSE